jgi:hypothetical protein
VPEGETPSSAVPDLRSLEQNQELQSLVWDKEESIGRIQMLLEARALAALQKLIPTKLEVSEKQHLRFSQFIKRFRAAIADVGKNIEITHKRPDKEIHTIALSIHENIRTLQADVREFFEHTLNKDNGHTLEAIQVAVDAITQPIKLEQLQDDPLYETIDLVSGGAKFEAEQFFTIQKKPEPETVIDKKNSIPTATIAPQVQSPIAKEQGNKENTGDVIPEFRWSWTDEELFGKEKLAECIRLPFSPEEVMEFWEETQNLLLKEFEDWRQEYLDKCGDKIMAEGSVISTIKLLDEIESEFKKAFPKVKEGISTFFKQSSFYVGSSENVAEAAAPILKKRIFFIATGAPQPTFIDRLIYDFFLKMCNGERLEYPVVDPSLVTSERKRYYRLKAFKADESHLTKGEIVDICCYQELPDDILNSTLTDMADSLKGNSAHSLRVGTKFLQKAVREGLEKTMPNKILLNTEIDCIDLCKNMLNCALDAVHAFTYKDLPFDLLMKLKNNASFMLSRNVREKALTLPVGITWPKANSEDEIKHALSNFYPQPKQENVLDFRWSWTDEELFQEKKLATLVRLAHSNEDIANLWSATYSQLINEFKNWKQESLRKCGTYVSYGEHTNLNTTGALDSIETDFKNALHKVQDGIIKYFRDTFRGNCTDVTKRAADMLKRVVIVFKGAPEPTFIETTLSDFFIELHAGETVEYPTIIDRPLITKDSTWYFQQATLLLNENPLRKSDLINILRDGDLVENIIELTLREFNESVKGNFAYSLREAVDLLQKQVIQGLEKKIPSKLSMNSQIEYVRLWKNSLNQALQIIEQFEYKSLPPSFLMQVKNAASFCIAARAREVSLRVLPSFNWPQESDEKELINELKNFFPESKKLSNELFYADVLLVLREKINLWHKTETGRQIGADEGTHTLIEMAQKATHGILRSDVGKIYKKWIKDLYREMNNCIFLLLNRELKDRPIKSAVDLQLLCKQISATFTEKMAQIAWESEKNLMNTPDKLKTSPVIQLFKSLLDTMYQDLIKISEIPLEIRKGKKSIEELAKIAQDLSEKPTTLSREKLLDICNDIKSGFVNLCKQTIPDVDTNPFADDIANYIEELKALIKKYAPEKLDSIAPLHSVEFGIELTKMLIRQGDAIVKKWNDKGQGTDALRIRHQIQSALEAFFTFILEQ